MGSDLCIPSKIVATLGMTNAIMYPRTPTLIAPVRTG